MAKNKRMGLRYFILSFLITFSVITLVGLAVLMSVLNPTPVQRITDNLPKIEHSFTDADSITVLCIGYSRKDTQNAYYSLVRLDAPAQRVFITSIPADTVISDLEGRTTALETAAYGGSQLLADTLSKALNLPIDRWLRIEERAFSDLVDELGAVTYDCKKAVTHYDESGFLAYSMSAGKHVFFGEKLGGLIKYSGDTEEERANEQSEILSSLFSQRLMSGKYDDIQAVFELVTEKCEGNINAFDLEARRAALEQIIEDKALIFTSISFSENEDKTPSEEYLKSLSAYR